MDFMKIIALSLIGEAIVETLKMVWQQGKLSSDRIIALVVSILITLASGMDIFSMAGIPLQVPYVGMILTAILASRGANFMHDLLQSVNNVMTNTKVTTIAAATPVKEASKAVEPSPIYNEPTAEKPVPNAVSQADQETIATYHRE